MALYSKTQGGDCGVSYTTQAGRRQDTDMAFPPEPFTAYMDARTARNDVMEKYAAKLALHSKTRCDSEYVLPLLLPYADLC
jgi:hypothetical protein